MRTPTCVETVLTVITFAVAVGILLALLNGCAGQNLTVNIGSGRSDGGRATKTITTDAAADVAREAQLKIPAETIPIKTLPIEVVQ